MNWTPPYPEEYRPWHVRDHTIRFEYDYFDHPRVQAVFRRFTEGRVGVCSTWTHSRDGHSMTIWFSKLPAGM